MEAGITARQAGTSMQQHKPSDSLNKQIEIIKLLTRLSLSRRVALDSKAMALDAQDLSIYELKDVEAALEIIRVRPRADGEAAYPAIAVMFEAVRGVIRASKPSEEQASANRYLRYVEAAKAEGVSKPDEEMQSVIDKMSAKFGFEKKKVIDTTPVLLCCPHCSQELPIAPNIRFWEPEELEALAGTMRSNRALAAANRAANLAAQASPLNEVTA